MNHNPDVKIEMGERSVLSNFEKIAKIPRASGHEGGIRDYLINFAKERDFDFQPDQVGNVFIQIPSNSMGHIHGIILQCHMDMVCKGKPDPKEVGVKPLYSGDGRYVYAQGTTLGADNGIGIASALSMAEESMKHGPIGLLFTVDEEEGLNGARNINFPEIERYSFLINLDSEEEGKITIGSAGGIRSKFDIPISMEKTADGYVFYNLNISGLQSGHSGVDIHKNRANAIELFIKILKEFDKDNSVKISYIKGGDVDNAIPAFVTSLIAVEKTTVVDGIYKKFDKFINGFDEPTAKITVTESQEKGNTFSKASQKKLIDLISSLPSGVISWDQQIKGLVRTSNNIGVINSNTKKVLIKTLCRSFDINERDGVVEKMTKIAHMYGSKVINGSSYPSWKEDKNSFFVQFSKNQYQLLFGEELEIEAIHAGLECGLIAAKYPQLNSVSIGPTMYDVHTTREKLEIATVSRFYRFLKTLIINLT